MSRNNKNAEPLASLNETLCGLGKVYEDKHSFYRIWLAYIPYVVIYKADLVEKILQSPTNIQKSGDYHFFRPWIKDCLLLSKGAKWEYRRKLLQPAFHATVLEQFVPIMKEHTMVLIDKINHHVSQSGDEKCAVLDTRKLMLPLTFDIICETAMGVKMNSQNEDKSKYIETLNVAVRKILKRIMTPWFWNDLVCSLFSPDLLIHEQMNIIEGFIYSVIRSRRKALLESKQQQPGDNTETSTPLKRKRLAFLDLLLEHNITDPSKWSEADIEEEMEFFFPAAHETTTESVVWTLFCLGNSTDCQAAVHREIDAIWEQYDLDREGAQCQLTKSVVWTLFCLGNSTDCQAAVHQEIDAIWEQYDLDREGAQCQLTSEHLNQMTYLEAVIKEAMRLYPPEAMRLYPPVVSVGRYISTDIVHESFVIPKGATVCILIEKLHRDPHFFPKPDAFLPERFLDPQAPHLGNSFAYIPFSGGKRNCIGGKMAMKELKIILSILLRHFSVQSLKKLGEIDIDPVIVSMPRGPVDIRYTPRL
ncbi:PREDICTED: cytochrome P450 4V2-like [Rhagoletis zephyria]|uniref:cytochrome P450 4V2-like n=1 Tax=Rhagoletis zephyria TaxID=28612 RepID=UPI00081199A2|nr:PREDICTED: cytochrome P450 4V2-like [Rhagoletis zephyria]